MHPCIIRTPSFQCSGNAKSYNPMYNTHPEFHSRGDDPSASVRLAACLDHSEGTTEQTEQWSVYFIYLTVAHPVRIRNLLLWILIDD